MIEAYDRQGLLRDVTGLSVNTLTNKHRNTASMRLRVEVPNLGALSKLLERIERLHNVVSAQRLSD
mgnify:CR=1 FL=1